MKFYFFVGVSFDDEIQLQRTLNMNGQRQKTHRPANTQTLVVPMYVPRAHARTQHKHSTRGQGTSLCIGEGKTAGEKGTDVCCAWRPLLQLTKGGRRQSLFGQERLEPAPLAVAGFLFFFPLFIFSKQFCYWCHLLGCLFFFCSGGCWGIMYGAVGLA